MHDLGGEIGIFNLHSYGENYFYIKSYGFDKRDNSQSVKYILFVRSNNIEDGIAEYKADCGID